MRRAQPPVFLHQSISQKVAAQFELALTSCKVCQALLPVDWKIDDTVLRSDNLIVCDITGNYLTKAPQLIVEILLKIYEEEGGRYYLIVDPQAQVVKVYDLFEGSYIKRLDASHELLDFDIAECNIQVDLAIIWP